MKKIAIDIIVIISITMLLLGLDYFNLLEKSAKFMLIPILAYYFIGKTIERKLNKK